MPLHAENEVCSGILVVFLRDHRHIYEQGLAMSVTGAGDYTNKGLTM